MITGAEEVINQNHIQPLFVPWDMLVWQRVSQRNEVLQPHDAPPRISFLLFAHFCQLDNHPLMSIRAALVSTAPREFL
jgi:hypothetical protein